MKIDGTPYRAIWVDEDRWAVRIIDQTLLPHRFETVRLTSLEDAARAIEIMQVRGAPLIGVTAAYGMCLALRQDSSELGPQPSQRPPPANAPDRHQSALGPGSDAQRNASYAGSRTARCLLFADSSHL